MNTAGLEKTQGLKKKTAGFFVFYCFFGGFIFWGVYYDLGILLCFFFFVATIVFLNCFWQERRK